MARALRRQPGFAAVAVLTLALGTGANTAILSVADTLLLRPPSVAHLDRLVTFSERNRDKIPFDVNPSPGNFLDWRIESRSFDVVAAWRNWYFTLAEPQAGGGPPEAVRGVRVSPDFFRMIGIDPALGGGFHADDEQPGRDRVVLLSDGLWRRRFGADPASVGRSLLVDGVPYRIVGVLPRGFHFFQPDLDVWMPLPVDAHFHDRQNHSVMVFARLAHGVTIAQAQSEMDAITGRMAAAYPDTNGGWHVTIASVYPTVEVRALRPALVMLLGAAGLVLLIACANVANLLLARGLARRGEIAMRAMLGASRARLIRQLMTESLVLGAAGGLAGVVIAYAFATALLPLLPHAGTNQSVSSFRAVSAALDLRLVGLSLAIAAATSVVFGIMPALQNSRVDALRESRSSAPSRAGRILISAELGLAIVLLIGAALLIESFWRLQRVDPGFRPDHLLTMQVWLPKAKYTRPEQIGGFYDEAIRRAAALPGVLGASAFSDRPYLSMGTGGPIDIEGRAPTRPNEPTVVEYRVVTPGFVRVIGQPIVAGRDFSASDRRDGDGVAIVNETMARRYWPDGRVIGRRIRPAFHRSSVPWEMDAEPRWLTVVGVARDIRGLAPAERDQSQLYVSSTQFPSSYMFLIVRTAVPPLEAAAAVRQQIRAIDADQPVSDIRTMEAAIADSVPRFNVELLGAFAVVAVLLAAVGVYGVSAFAVTQRAQEIGVRVALGAQSRDVLALIMRHTLAPGLAGVAAGIVAALMMTRTLAALLYGVSPDEPFAYAGAATLLTAVMLVACYVPARKAARLDPAETLRT
jgi:putative ABC transport system permease protein